MKNNILIWDTSIAEMLSGGKFGGIAIQLNFWGNEFNKNGWEIHAITYRKSFDSGIYHFHHIKNIKSLNIGLEWFYALKLLKTIKPKYILIRGAQRALFPLTFLSKVAHSSLIFFGASDVNFIPEKADVGNSINRILYNKAILKTPIIITQNNYQKETLKRNFGRDSLTIPNIWSDLPQPLQKAKPYDCVWISNFRKLKRAELVIALAERFPQYSFAIAGAPNDVEYYNRIKFSAQRISNLDFLGPVSFDYSNSLISSAKILICTSEYEGFPNTFLQAWYYGKPIVSTVDPNNLISKNNLGCYCKDTNGLGNSILTLLADSHTYRTISDCINTYFKKAHCSNAAFSQLMKYPKEINY